MQQTGEALAMRGFKKHLWNGGIASIGVLLLLMCLALIPPSATSAHEGTPGVATPTTVTVQAKPTEDATVTALNKEKLQHENDWWWTYRATILSSFLSALVLVIGALIGFGQWRVNRNDTRTKELRDRAEERFQLAVTGLGDKEEGPRIGAAILLRTFLRPGYEQFYIQTFDLAVAHLRLPRVPQPPEAPATSPSLTTLSLALIGIFRESFPLARDLLLARGTLKEEDAQDSLPFLDAMGIQLDHAYLNGADLKQVWMPFASLQFVDLRWADLSRAEIREAKLGGSMLVGANFSGANLLSAGLNSMMAFFLEANFSGANLSWSDFSSAEFSKANFSGADLREANLSESFLTGANLEDAQSLEKTILRGVKGLTKEQKAICKAKGAIIDEDSTASASQSAIAPSSLPQSNDAQAPSAPSAQGSTPLRDLDGSNAASSQQEPKP